MWGIFSILACLAGFVALFYAMALLPARWPILVLGLVESGVAIVIIMSILSNAKARKEGPK